MCGGRDELLARGPEDLPTYADPRLSNYSYLDEVGVSERVDPYYFAPSMVRRILQCPDQEIATHSYSHYYCLEPGQTDDQFRADLRAATAQLREWNIDCRSIVFRSEEHTSELQPLMRISYAVFCLKKKKKKITNILHKIH